MRNLCLLALLCAPLAMAESLVKVAPHSLLRLPTHASTLQLDRLEIADHASLLLPANLSELRVGELRMGRDAHIGIAPSETAFVLDVAQGEIAEGSHIGARGAPGNYDRPASAGRTLALRLEQVQVESLSIDARGGRGTPGYRGLDGAKGQPAGCLWGDAGRGYDGQNGGDGQDGAPGGKVRLEVPADFPVERIQVRLEGGAGGPAGEPGEGGPGGAAKGCLLYRADGSAKGRPGQPGQPGAQGAEGQLEVVRFE
ncbi:hypothetical protein [Pseudomonas indica]|uniref:hypothetical protein n=1 Tax=Pseudomonas indica TaxID=137658 RepID=UPI000BAB95FF|nr:hypothetical protein [Pseudomonas indica]PAU64678.1 collagen pro alpha-chain precursor [Pseudomonas indica]